MNSHDPVASPTSDATVRDAGEACRLFRSCVSVLRGPDQASATSFVDANEDCAAENGGGLWDG